jgi:hypothetical protein
VVISEFTLWHKLPMPLKRGSSCRLMGRMGSASDSFKSKSLKAMRSFLSVFSRRVYLAKAYRRVVVGVVGMLSLPLAEWV